MDLRRLNSFIIAICVCAAFTITSSKANGIQKLLSKGPAIDSRGLAPPTQSDQENESDNAAILEQTKVNEFSKKLSSIEKSFQNTNEDDNNSDLSSVVKSFIQPIHNIICQHGDASSNFPMPANCFCQKPCTSKLCFPALGPLLCQCITSPASLQQAIQYLNCLKLFPVANQQPIKPFATLPKMSTSPYNQQFLQSVLPAIQQLLQNLLQFPTAQQQPSESLQGAINTFGVLPQPTIFPCPEYGYPFYPQPDFVHNLFWELLSSNNPSISKIINSLLSINQLGFGNDPIDLTRQPIRGFNIYDLLKETCCVSTEPPIQY